MGGLPLLAWGSMGRSVAFGATLPGEGYALRTVLFGEVITTFALVAGLCLFLGFRRLRPFTPALFPFLYSFMVYLEAAVSGTSTNPCPQPWPGHHFRSLERMVDLLGRPGVRHPCRSSRLQLPREANRGCEAVSLRHRSRPVGSKVPLTPGTAGARSGRSASVAQ